VGAVISDLLITPLKIVDLTGGDVLHAMKASDPGFSGFGEAYFSTIKPGVIKGWKRHRRMVLNLVVPIGEVRFVVCDDRQDLSTGVPLFQEVVLSRDHYCRLTVPPMLWVGFQGVSGVESVVQNIASIAHDPGESDVRSIEEFNFDWGVGL